MSTTTNETTEQAEVQEQQEVTETAQESQEQAPEQAPEQEAAADQDDAAQEDPQDDSEDDSPTRKLRAEAKKYRTQLREVEAERDTLAETVEHLRQRQAETALDGILQKPESLWLTGATAADFYAEDGTLDVESLHSAAREASREHGLQPHKRFHGSADMGSRQAAPLKPRFSDAFGPRR